MLDLFCGEGLAALGYMSTGRFSRCEGVDINPKMSTRYSYDFLCANALECNYEYLGQFDFIHASPPCQAYSKTTPDKSKHQKLIAATHRMLFASGKPYVIENVEGSGQELRPNLVMNGLYFGLPSSRKRYFHVSTLAAPVRLIVGTRCLLSPQDGTLNKQLLIHAMGLDKFNTGETGRLTKKGIEQGIPPIFTAYIANMMFDNSK